MLARRAFLLAGGARARATPAAFLNSAVKLWSGRMRKGMLIVLVFGGKRLGLNSGNRLSPRGRPMKAAWGCRSPSAFPLRRSPSRDAVRQTRRLPRRSRRGDAVACLLDDNTDRVIEQLLGVGHGDIVFEFFAGHRAAADLDSSAAPWCCRARAHARNDRPSRRYSLVLEWISSRPRNASRRCVLETSARFLSPLPVNLL